MDQAERPRPPTIRDVAARAGVSVGTVSHVLSGDRAVRPALRARVTEAAQALGWRANPHARGLRQARSDVVGLVLPSTASAFHAAFGEALEEVLAGDGRMIMQAHSRGDPEQEALRVGALLDRRVDALVLMPTAAPAAAIAALDAAALPTVLIGAPPRPPRFDAVTLDEAAAMRAALAHLMARGHRRVLFLVRFPALPVTAARIAALNAARGVAAEVMAFGADQARFERDFPARLSAPDRPTAVIASNSILAAWALRALRRLRLDVPRDIALLAFDDSVWAALTDPPLTVMRQPVAAMAEAAWRLLRERQADPAMPPRSAVLAMDLMERESA